MRLEPSSFRLLPALVIAGGFLGGLAPSPALGKPAAKQRPEAAAYLEEMERRGLIDKTQVTPARLTEEVRAADDELVAGNAALAAARLYAIVEGPRYQDFSDTEDFQDAEYRLGIALHRGGGLGTARHYLGRSLARGPKASFYEAALRAYVDVCLDARTLEPCVAELDRMGAEDQNGEIAYLRGRGDFEAGRASDAESELGRVSPKSRFYSSALYLRGVLRVNHRDLKGAQDAFCSIADVKDGDSVRFYIDGRYYALRDLARLALGRIAHEEGRYEDAFYHYFLIPQDSNRLGEALFEAAWSSLERREFDLGARLVAEFLKAFPRSPKASEARLLLATLQVKTCRFAEAETGFASFLSVHEPLLAAIDRAIADPAVLHLLGSRLLAQRAEGLESKPGQKEPPEPTDDEGRIAALLDVDARFFRLAALARGLDEEGIDADHVEKAWGQLATRLGGTQVHAASTAEIDPATLGGKVQALGREIARARQALRQRGTRSSAGESAELERALLALEKRRDELGERIGQALASRNEGNGERGAQGLEPLVRADHEHATELRARLAAQRDKLTRASGELVREALSELRGRLEDSLRRARLGKIDAVVGQKRKLERQIEDLAAGRFPPEMFGRLHIEGLIRDDEEYWPPEKEIWLDEYENYK